MSSEKVADEIILGIKNRLRMISIAMLFLVVLLVATFISFDIWHAFPNPLTGAVHWIPEAVLFALVGYAEGIYSRKKMMLMYAGYMIGFTVIVSVIESSGMIIPSDPTSSSTVGSIVDTVPFWVPIVVFLSVLSAGWVFGSLFSYRKYLKLKRSLGNDSSLSIVPVFALEVLATLFVILSVITLLSWWFCLSKSSYSPRDSTVSTDYDNYDDEDEEEKPWFRCLYCGTVKESDADGRCNYCGGTLEEISKNEILERKRMLR